jgi:hypothetical protein
MAYSERLKARTAGLKKYWSGVPCANGHTDYRDTKTYVCLSCRRMHTQKRRNYKIKNAIEGKISGHYRCDPLDFSVIKEFIDAVNFARSLSSTTSRPPEPDTSSVGMKPKPPPWPSFIDDK